MILTHGYVQVTTTIDQCVDNDLYIPICPTPKNRKTNMQLKIRDDPLGTRGFYLRSFVRLDAVHEVPLDILQEQLSYGRQLELKAQSYRNLLHFMRQKNIG